MTDREFKFVVDKIGLWFAQLKLNTFRETFSGDIYPSSALVTRYELFIDELKKNLEFSSKIKFEKSIENSVSNGTEVEGYNPFDDFRMPDGDSEPTEFEKVFANLVGHYHACKNGSDEFFSDIEFAQEYAVDLMNIARKQIISELNKQDAEFYKLILAYNKKRIFAKFCTSLINWWDNTRGVIKAIKKV